MKIRAVTARRKKLKKQSKTNDNKIQVKTEENNDALRWNKIMM